MEATSPNQIIKLQDHQRKLEMYQGKHSIKHPCFKKIIEEEKNTYQIMEEEQDHEGSA